MWVFRVQDNVCWLSSTTYPGYRGCSQPPGSGSVSCREIKQQKEASDGFSAHHRRDTPPAPWGVPAGGYRQTVLDQHPTYDPRLYPGHSPRRVGHREILTVPVASFFQRVLYQATSAA